MGLIKLSSQIQYRRTHQRYMCSKLIVSSRSGSSGRALAGGHGMLLGCSWGACLRTSAVGLDLREPSGPQLHSHSTSGAPRLSHHALRWSTGETWRRTGLTSVLAVLTEPCNQGNSRHYARLQPIAGQPCKLWKELCSHCKQRSRKRDATQNSVLQVCSRGRIRADNCT